MSWRVPRGSTPCLLVGGAPHGKLLLSCSSTPEHSESKPPSGAHSSDGLAPPLSQIKSRDAELGAPFPFKGNGHGIIKNLFPPSNPTNTHEHKPAYTYSHTHRLTHMLSHSRSHMCVSTHIYTLLHTGLHTCVFTHPHVRTHAPTLTYTHVHTRGYKHKQSHVYPAVYACTHMHARHTPVCTCTPIHAFPLSAQHISCLFS